MNNWKDLSTTIPGLVAGVAMIATAFGMPEEIGKAIIAVSMAILGICSRSGNK